MTIVLVFLVCVVVAFAVAGAYNVYYENQKEDNKDEETQKGN